VRTRCSIQLELLAQITWTMRLTVPTFSRSYREERSLDSVVLSGDWRMWLRRESMRVRFTMAVKSGLVVPDVEVRAMLDYLSCG
jgi:hypothetical protein